LIVELVPKGLAVRRGGIVFVGSAVGDVAVDDDERRSIVCAAEIFDRLCKPYRVVGISYALYRPAIRKKARRNVCGVVSPAQGGAGQVGLAAIAGSQRCSRSSSGSRVTSGRTQQPRARPVLGLPQEFSLAGGLLLIAFGTDAAQVKALLSHPQLSSHPYSAHQVAH
jgi:hypothetical protein